jgi:DNA-binding NtrC family response regulator
VKAPFTILIAERNRNVREFLKREMCAEGYQVHTVANAAQLLDAVSSDRPPEIIILDLDLPDAGNSGIVAEIKSMAPDIPVIVHTLPVDVEAPLIKGTVAFIEKRENSIEDLKKKVGDILGWFPGP